MLLDDGSLGEGRFMGRLDIKLLGPFRANLDGEKIAGFNADKVRALLIYLAVEGDQIHRREKLAGLLWPEWPKRSARTNLRSALADVRVPVFFMVREPGGRDSLAGGSVEKVYQ